MRSFKAADLVTLPRVSAEGGRTLASRVLAAAAQEKLGVAMTEAVEEVKTGLDVLTAVMNHASTPAVDPLAAQAADARLTGCWAALYATLGAWLRVPELPEASAAQAILETVFPEGLAFTRLAYADEWSTSDRMLIKIEEDQLTNSIDALGGSKILRTLRRAHRDYGVVLGITSVDTSTKVTKTVREALLELMDALRGYVLQATALQRRSDPRATALSERLLKPIAEFHTRATAAGRAEDAKTDAASATSPDATTGVPTAAPVAPLSPSSEAHVRAGDRSATTTVATAITNPSTIAVP